MIKPMRLNITILLLLTAISCLAQTVAWEMEPTNLYREVQYIGFKMFQVTAQNGKIGVIDSKGSVIVEAVCDEITPFYEDYALLLVNNNNKVQIIGNLTTQGKCHLFSQDRTFYTLQGQAFYSCGMLTVEDDHGRKGYIDEEGKPAIGLGNGVEFSKIKPFSEGFAAVFDKDKNYMLIDKLGKKEQFSFPNVVREIPNGTNVYQGKVFVIDTQNDFYSYDVYSKKTCVKERPKTLSPDYLFRFSGQGTEIPYTALPAVNPNIKLQESDKKFGYIRNNKLLLPCQFDQASSFIDDLAVVRKDNQFGVLRFYPEGTTPFVIEAVNPTSIDYKTGKSVVCKFKVSAPVSFDISKLSATVNGTKASYKGNDIFSFSYSPVSSGKQSVTVTISDKGLLMLSSSLEYLFNEVKPSTESQEEVKPEKEKQEKAKVKQEDEKKKKDNTKDKEQKPVKKNDNNTKSNNKQKDKNADKDKSTKESPKKNQSEKPKKDSKNKEDQKKKNGEKKKKDIKLF